MRNLRLVTFVAILFLGLPALTQNPFPAATSAAEPNAQNSTSSSGSSANSQGLVPSSAVVAPVAVATSSSKPKPFLSFDHEGLRLQSKSKWFQAKVHGFVEGDGRFFSTDLQGGSKDTLLFRRVRPILDGTLFGTLDFRFMPDFGQGIAVIQDAYVETRVPRFTKLRIGKFKAPVGLEQLQTDINLMFVERSLATNLVPNRDLGVQLGGDAFAKSIAYAIGFFNGVSDNSNANFDWHTGNSLDARVFFQPFKTFQNNPLQGLGFGLGASTGNEYGSVPKYKTIGQDTFFKYSSGTLANGQHNRLSPQAYYYRGPLGLMGEYMISSQAVRNATTAMRVRNEAWQAEGSLLLTGGKNAYDGVRPNFGFEPTRNIRHWGGIELVTRCSRFRIDPGAFAKLANPATSAQRAGEWGVGLNWYPNRFLKFMTDYEQTDFHMMSDKGHLPTEKVVMSRIQLAF